MPVGESAESVLEFWFSEVARPLWFRSTAAFDAEIRDKFLATWEAAAAGKLDHWMEQPQDALALIIVLDQFPLNMFRGQALSYTTEAKARRVADHVLAQDWNQDFDDSQRMFLYLPFMHSESLADQDRSVALYEAAGLGDSLRWARHHREIIRRFGRFPHRNAPLGRASTPEEIEWLQSDEGFAG